MLQQWSSHIHFSHAVLFLSVKASEKRRMRHASSLLQSKPVQLPVSQVILTSFHYARETLRYINVFQSITDKKNIH